MERVRVEKKVFSLKVILDPSVIHASFNACLWTLLRFIYLGAASPIIQLSTLSHWPVSVGFVWNQLPEPCNAYNWTARALCLVATTEAVAVSVATAVSAISAEATVASVAAVATAIAVAVSTAVSLQSILSGSILLHRHEVYERARSVVRLMCA